MLFFEFFYLDENKIKSFKRSDWSTFVSHTVENIPSPPSEEIDGMSCRQIIDYIYANVAQTDYMNDRVPDKYFTGWHRTTEQIKNGESWFLGIENIPFTEATAAESPISIADFSLVVIRLEADADADRWRDSVYDNLNPRKWLSAGGDEKRVERIGNVILAVIADMPDIDNIVSTFKALA